jgi:hypothetical protein
MYYVETEDGETIYAIKKQKTVKVRSPIHVYMLCLFYKIITYLRGGFKMRAGFRPGFCPWF